MTGITAIVHLATLPDGKQILLPANTVVQEASAKDLKRFELKQQLARAQQDKWNAGDRRDSDSCDRAEREITKLERALAKLKP